MRGRDLAAGDQASFTPASAGRPLGAPAGGDLALVLHAHRPYVHSREPGSLEEDWYFEALLESYLPLLDALEAAAADPSQRPRLSLGLSPTLLSLLSNPLLAERFGPWLAVRLQLLDRAPASYGLARADLARQLAQTLANWRACGANLVPRFRRLQEQGVLDLLTCAATHGYLPLLRDRPEAVRAFLAQHAQGLSSLTRREAGKHLG